MSNASYFFNRWLEGEKGINCRLFFQQVTGGNKGIGYAIVKELCAKFDGQVVLAARDEGRGKAAVEELKKVGCVVFG